MDRQKNKTILISRFSAFGDVIMTVKPIKLLVKQNPNYNFILLTRPLYAFFFKDIERLTVITPNLKNEYKGVKGIWKLSRELKKYQIHAFADIHNVLRTKLLRFFLFFSGVKSTKINKGRLAKKRLINSKSKIKPLKNMVERYTEVFHKLGLKLDLSESLPQAKFPISKEANSLISQGIKIGVAPFALHKQKMYPIEKMRHLTYMLSKKSYNIYIFGGGENEKTQAESLIKDIPNTLNLIGRFRFADELAIMDRLDLIITMDSSNMHLANLTSTKILTIWGGTHPFIGFSPYKNPNYHEIQIDDSQIDCRPCSVYGKKPCRRNDLACMNLIEPKTVFNKIETLLNPKT